MNLWLLRHGEAELIKTTDSSRNLTQQGKYDVIKTAQLLKNMPIDVVLHSPFKRAVQTAQLVCNEIDYKGRVEEVDWITPDDSPQQVIMHLDNYEQKNILMVSHQPLLGKLVGLLTQGSLSSATTLQTAELVHLQGDGVYLAGMSIKK